MLRYAKMRDIGGRFCNTLDSSVLEQHENLLTCMSYQMFVVAVHFLESVDEFGNYGFSSFKEAEADYTGDETLASQFKLVLESLAHRNDPESLRRHGYINIPAGKTSQDLVNEECWYINEEFAKQTPYSLHEVQVARDLFAQSPNVSKVLTPGNPLYDNFAVTLNCAKATHSVMKRVTNKNQYAA